MSFRPRRPGANRSRSNYTNYQPSNRPPSPRSCRPKTRPWLLVVLTVLGFAVGASLAWLGSNLPSILPSRPAVTQVDPIDGVSDSDELATGPSVIDDTNDDTSADTDNLMPVANPHLPYEIHPWAKQSYVPVVMYHDVVAETKEVWFDHTAAELRRDFEAIEAAGATPITITDLYEHLRNGKDLPEKPIVLTFDDAYQGLYDNAFPLLQEFNYPAAYYVQTGFVGVPTSKDHFTWDQMREMEASGLIEFAAHTISHPEDLRLLDDDTLRREIFESKRVLEEQLGHEIRHFAYPAGNRDDRVLEMVEEAGFIMATTMDAGYTGQSSSLLEVQRFNQFRLTEALIGAKAVQQGEWHAYQLDAAAPVELEEETVDDVHLYLMRGGRAATVHADARYNVSTLIDRYQATAGINGSFFSLPWIYASSNVMVGPVQAANNGLFVPGREEDNRAIRGRPLVLMGEDRLSFVPFHPELMNDPEFIQQMMPDVTDLFVAGLWLVKDGRALSLEELESFHLSSAAEARPRVFFGVDRQNRLVVGVTETHIYSLKLAEILPKLGIQEAILLDSGFSSSLVYEGEILATGHATAEQPSRPVPHAILLYDLYKLAQAPPNRDPLTRLVKTVPADAQADTEQVLQAVLDGDGVFEKGDRGSAVLALQRGLEMVAISNGDDNPLPSGADGVYGNEVVSAIAPYLPGGLSRSSSIANSSLSHESDSPVALGSSGFVERHVATNSVEDAIGNASGPGDLAGTTINQHTLRALLDAVETLPSPVLVDPELPVGSSHIQSMRRRDLGAERDAIR
ncbi:MAG: polysaccharide deacetylase family protein [Cyanobacteria bacterium P01_E01_bin.45]